MHGNAEGHGRHLPWVVCWRPDCVSKPQTKRLVTYEDMCSGRPEMCHLGTCWSVHSAGAALDLYKSARGVNGQQGEFRIRKRVAEMFMHLHGNVAL